MPLHFALLLSLALHTALIVVPNWLEAKPRPPPTPNIEARLMPHVEPPALAEAVSTEAESPDSAVIPPRLEAPPSTLRGHALRRAQAALSAHLFYPPQAVAEGLEGEVILLLILSDSGKILSTSIARSSGHAVLDQAAQEAARSIGALPGSPRQTLFPVNFRLQ